MALLLACVRTHESESESTLQRGFRNHSPSAAQTGQSAEPNIMSEYMDVKEGTGIGGASPRGPASMCLYEIFHQLDAPRVLYCSTKVGSKRSKADSLQG